MTQTLASRPVTSKRCPSCEYRNAPDDLVCRRCGTRLDVPLRQPTPAPRSRSAPPSNPREGITCKACGTKNRPGALVCAHCFAMLSADGETIPNTVNISEAEAARYLQLNTIDEWTDETGAYKGVTAGTSVFESNMVVCLRAKSVSTPIRLHFKQQAQWVLGRVDPSMNQNADVDLSPYAGQQLGVSRHHALLRLRGTRLELVDLSSSNGTYLNGTRLAAEDAQQLRDGDSLKLGKLELQLFFQLRQGPE